MSTKTQAGKFLEKLNIRRRSKPPRLDGIVPTLVDCADDVYDAMNTHDINALFSTEEIAIEVLSADHERLITSMLRVSNAPVQNELKTIADLGGGTGIVSLWLATQNPSCRIRVYDRSANSLQIGKRWAEKLGLSERVTFHLTSYEELATSDSPAKDCDFVFAEYAVDFNDYSDVFGELAGTQIFESKRKRYCDLAGAIASLLSDDGIGLIASGETNPWTLELFAVALRESGLHLDWQLTPSEGVMSLFLRVGNSHLFDSAEEDALTILTLGSIKAHRQLGPPETLSLLKVFKQKGKAYLRIQMHGLPPSKVGNPERCEMEILQLGGICLLSERWGNGVFRSIYHTAAAMPALAKLCMKSVSAPGSTAQSIFLDDRLNALMKTTAE